MAPRICISRRVRPCEPLDGNGTRSIVFGHWLGLQLDESPVKRFRPSFAIGGTMAIEPKVVHSNGIIGSEDLG